MKASDLIGDFIPPEGDVGRDIPWERANQIMLEIRDMLDVVYKFNCVVDHEELIAAWQYLNPMERRAYNLCVQARGRHVGE